MRARVRGILLRGRLVCDGRFILRGNYDAMAVSSAARVSLIINIAENFRRQTAGILGLNSV